MEPEKQVKVIMVTGMADRDIIIDCKMEGCDDYVVKPFNRETVIAEIIPPVGFIYCPLRSR